LASDILLTTLHPLLENVLQTVDHFEISYVGAPFPWLEKPRNRMGLDLNWILCSDWKKWVGRTPSEHPPYSPDLAPCDFWAFPTMKREFRGKKFRSDQRLAARFWEVGGALKKCIACQGRYFEKETVTAPPQSSDSEELGEYTNLANGPHICVCVWTGLFTCEAKQMEVPFKDHRCTLTYVIRNCISQMERNVKLVLRSKGRPKFHINKVSLGYFIV
jgi:hypothetical protein